MNPKKYKSVAMKITSWELATELAKVVLPNAVLSRSQVVEIALTRWANERKFSSHKFPMLVANNNNEVSSKTLNKG